MAQAQFNHSPRVVPSMQQPLVGSAPGYQGMPAGPSAVPHPDSYHQGYAPQYAQQAAAFSPQSAPGFIDLSATGAMAFAPGQVAYGRQVLPPGQMDGSQADGMSQV